MCTGPWLSFLIQSIQSCEVNAIFAPNVHFKGCTFYIRCTDCSVELDDFTANIKLHH